MLIAHIIIEFVLIAAFAVCGIDFGKKLNLLIESVCFLTATVVAAIYIVEHEILRCIGHKKDRMPMEQRKRIMLITHIIIEIVLSIGIIAYFLDYANIISVSFKDIGEFTLIIGVATYLIEGCILIKHRKSRKKSGFSNSANKPSASEYEAGPTGAQRSAFAYKVRSTDVKNAEKACETKFTIGNYIEFGHYPQASSNEASPIEWLVLARGGNNALLLSRYGLDAQPYNEDYETITWKNCTLRTWLNDAFINKAFTVKEQTAILVTNVDNGRSQCNSGYATNGGSNTLDKVFLLSYTEAQQYLNVTRDGGGDNIPACAAPTDYAKLQGAYTSDSIKTADGEYTGWWWLRSPGRNQSSAVNIDSNGSPYSHCVDHGNGCVRPALWVSLKSSSF